MALGTFRVRLHAMSIVVTVGLVAGMLVGGATAAIAASINSSGPLTRVEISDTLNCAVDHAGDVSPEFYGDIACGTLLAVDGTLYGPPNIPAGAGANRRRRAGGRDRRHQRERSGSQSQKSHVSRSPPEKLNLRADRREAPCPKHGAS